jgi:hypothetical protein
MGQTNEELTENLAEWLCWEVARRDDVCIARRLYRKPVVKVLLQKLVFDPFLMLTDVCSVHATRRRSSSGGPATGRTRNGPRGSTGATGNRPCPR